MRGDETLDDQYLETMLYYAEQVKERLYRAARYNIPADDDMVVESLALLLGQIGEQLDSGKLSKELQARYADGKIINFREISKFRNKAYHHYGAMNNKLILDTAKEIDVFIEKIKQVIELERRVRG